MPIDNGIFVDFTQPLDSHWTQTCVGGATLRSVESALRMEFPSARSGHYVDAQIDDYTGRVRSAFPWKPPLRMEVQARSSLPAANAKSTNESAGILRGTAGFGFWNYPFSITGDLLFLPEAIWFFYASPPSNMALVPGVPGWGWKAQVVHSMRTNGCYPHSAYSRLVKAHRQHSASSTMDSKSQRNPRSSNHSRDG